jgi:hypothetical protein
MTTPADELHAAAQRLRDVAPDITGPLAGLADPVADWLDYAAAAATRLHSLFADSDDPGEFIEQRALAVARQILGGEQP